MSELNHTRVELPVVTSRILPRLIALALFVFSLALFGFAYPPLRASEISAPSFLEPILIPGVRSWALIGSDGSRLGSFTSEMVRDDQYRVFAKGRLSQSEGNKGVPFKGYLRFSDYRYLEGISFIFVPGERELRMVSRSDDGSTVDLSWRWFGETRRMTLKIPQPVLLHEISDGRYGLTFPRSLEPVLAANKQLRLAPLESEVVIDAGSATSQATELEFFQTIWRIAEPFSIESNPKG